MPDLNEWYVYYENDNPYLAPELQTSRIAGKVYGHPKFKDGENIAISPVIGLEGEILITRSGSRYKLGTPKPDYAKKFPDARNRLLENVRKGLESEYN